MWFVERAEKKRDEKDVEDKNSNDDKVEDYQELDNDRRAQLDNDGDDEFLNGGHTANEIDDDRNKDLVHTSDNEGKEGKRLDDNRVKAKHFDDERVENQQELDEDERSEFDNEGNDGLNDAKAAGELHDSRDTRLHDNGDEGKRLDDNKDKTKHFDDDRVDNHQELEDYNKAGFDSEGNDGLNNARVAEEIHDSRDTGMDDNGDERKESDDKRDRGENLDEDWFDNHQELQDDKNAKLDNEGDEGPREGSTARDMNDSRDNELNVNLNEEETRSDSKTKQTENVDDDKVEDHQESDDDKQATSEEDLKMVNNGDDGLKDEMTAEGIGDGRDKELDENWEVEGKKSDDNRKTEDEMMDREIETDGNDLDKEPFETELYDDVNEDRDEDLDDWSEGDDDDGLDGDEEMSTDDSNPFRKLRGIGASVDEEMMNNQIMLKFKEWIRLEYLGNKPKTVTQHLRQFAAMWTAISKENIAEVTNKANIRRFVTEMMESKKLQPGSIRGYLSSLRMFLNFAIEEELPEINIIRATNCKASLANLSASLKKSIRQRQVDLYVSEVGKFTAYF